MPLSIVFCKRGLITLSVMVFGLSSDNSEERKNEDVPCDDCPEHELLFFLFTVKNH